MREIRFTKSKAPYGWMGNMSRFPVTWNDKTYGSTEHLFQAMRFGLDTEWAELVRNEDNPYQAKQIAKTNREHMIVEPCGDEDLANMYQCLMAKIRAHEDLKVELMGTIDCHIYEDVTFRGDVGSNLFWGAMKLEDGTWKGNNVVGDLWMKVRDTLLPDMKAKTEMEIERRFLLKSVPDIKYGMDIEIGQHYLSPKGDKETERVRAITQSVNGNVLGDRWIHTIKQPTNDLGMLETEEEITWEAFSVGKDNADRSVYKTRHVYHLREEGLVWEIDEFKGLNLVIAEIEIPSEDYDLVIPEAIKPYILLEITGMHQFSNSNLAE
jgi:hypothetical protein